MLRRRQQLPRHLVTAAVMALCGIGVQSALAGAAPTAAARPADQTAPARSSFSWQGVAHTSIRGLRAHVVDRGGSWERFLRRNEAAVAAFALTPIAWDSQRFYSRDGMRAWLRVRGRAYETWSAGHRSAHAQLVQNGSALLPLRTMRKPKVPVASTPAPTPTPTPTPMPTPPAPTPPAPTPPAPTPPAPTPPAPTPPTPAPPPAPGFTPATLTSGPSDSKAFGLANGYRLSNASELQQQVGIGASWNRVDFAWASIESTRGSYVWTSHDDFVRDAKAAGVGVVATLAYTPTWARPAGTSFQYEPYEWAEDDFAKFAAAAVKRYAPQGVRHYEIWNEPNISAFWLPKPNPARYTRLLRKAYAAIKATGHDVVVISGGLSPAGSYTSHPLGGSSVNPVAFLEEMYRQGAAGNFDALGHHPYDHGLGPYGTNAAGAWYQMFGTSPSLRSLMEANGDGAKKIHATEFGLPTSVDGHTEAKQATWIRDAVTRWRSHPWAGVLTVYLHRDGMNGTGYVYSYGLIRADGTPKPAWWAFRDAMK